jgi:DNA mismatch repair protein MSH3
VESFFSKNTTDKDGARNKRALAIQKAIDARGSGARKALQKYKLADDLVIASSRPSGVAFDDYHVSATQAPEGVNVSKKGNGNEESDGTTSHAPPSQLQQERHEAWQKRLEGPSGLVPRRRSLNLDEAEAREARAALAAARGEEYVPELDEAEMEMEGGGDLGGIDLNESVPASRAKSAKAVGAKSAKGRGKKKEEVGPSGLSYTPLEKQVRRLECVQGSLADYIVDSSWRSRLQIRTVCYW